VEAPDWRRRARIDEHTDKRGGKKGLWGEKKERAAIPLFRRTIGLG